MEAMKHAAREDGGKDMALYLELLNQSNDAIYVIDPETGRFIFVNEKSCASLGFNRGCLLGMTVKDVDSLIPDHDAWMDHVAQVKRAGSVIFEGEHRRSDGTAFPVEVNVRHVAHENRDYIVAVARDVTERKRALAAMRESAEMLEKMFSTTHVLYACMDSEFHFLRVNRAYASADNREPEFFGGKNHFDLYPDKENEAIFRNVVETGRPYTAYAKPFVYAEHPERGTSWWDFTLAPVKGSGGGVEGVLLSLVNVTERRKAEDDLRDTERELTAIFEHVPMVMMLLDENRRVLRVNRLATSFTGLSMDDTLGLLAGEALQCIHAHDVPAGCGAGPHCEQCVVRRTVTNTLETGESRNLMEVKHRFNIGGQERELSLFLTTRRLTVRQKHAVLVSIQDISDFRKLEEQLRQSQKMEGIGQLAGGIAHDFNNILSAIIGYASIVLMKMERDDPQRLNIEPILEAADRAAHLTKDLLLFSRKQISERKPADLNEIIRRMEKFLKRVIGEDIACRTILNPPSEGLMVLADAHQIEQVLMNLATNARDAMPNGGVFAVTTERIRFDETFITAHGYGRPGMYALITVSDTGKGMDEDTKQRIFEPFFTTKDAGKGTGLGMAVVYGIIKQHEGYINIYSEQGAGTTFRIYLPLIKSGIGEEVQPAEQEYPAGGTETILLAEDDETVRNMTVSILQDFGYTVITAVDGEDAVNRYSGNKDAIRLLLFDLVLPGISGKDACDMIKRITPGIKTIFTTGYAPDLIRHKVMLENGIHLVHKPVSPVELLKKVRAVLDNP